MKPQHKELYRYVHDVFLWLSQSLESSAMQSNDETDITQLVDEAYIYEQIEKMCDELRKLAKKKKLFVSEQAAQMYLMDASNKVATGEGADARIQTEYCSAKPDTKPYTPYPNRKDAPCYGLMMQQLGVPEWTWTAFENELLRPHYPGVLDYTKWLIDNNHPLPPGFDPEKIQTNFVMSFRKKKDIL